MSDSSRSRVLVSAFTCSRHGKSEGYVGYKWLEQISRFCDATLVTADDAEAGAPWRCIQPSRRFVFQNKLLRKMNGEIMFDYFWFNYQSWRRLRRPMLKYDLVHHVVPIAPRYPCSLGTLAPRFILGPLGGGLRVPESFRKEVEGREEWFYKLRSLDHARLNFDPFLRRTYRAADIILLVGSYMFDLIPSCYHKKCRLMLETGIDSQDYNPAPMEISANSRSLRLLYVGRVVPYKGLVYALKSLDRLPSYAKARIHLTVVGDRGEGGYEAQCKQFVQERGLQAMVTFVGKLRKEEILRFYEECDLFVFPSLAETSGNVLLEAMAVARPVLAVKRGGPAEMVRPEAGFLLEPTDPESLIQQMRELLVGILGNGEQLRQKGLGARKLIESVFDWRAKGSALARLYGEVLSPIGDPVQVSTSCDALKRPESDSTCRSCEHEFPACVSPTTKSKA